MASKSIGVQAARVTYGVKVQTALAGAPRGRRERIAAMDRFLDNRPRVARC